MFLKRRVWRTYEKRKQIQNNNTKSLNEWNSPSPPEKIPLIFSKGCLLVSFSPSKHLDFNVCPTLSQRFVKSHQMPIIYIFTPAPRQNRTVRIIKPSECASNVAGYAVRTAAFESATSRTFGACLLCVNKYTDYAAHGNVADPLRTDFTCLLSLMFRIRDLKSF